MLYNGEFIQLNDGYIVKCSVLYGTENTFVRYISYYWPLEEKAYYLKNIHDLYEYGICKISYLGILQDKIQAVGIMSSIQPMRMKYRYAPSLNRYVIQHRIHIFDRGDLFILAIP